MATSSDIPIGALVQEQGRLYVVMANHDDLLCCPITIDEGIETLCQDTGSRNWEQAVDAAVSVRLGAQTCRVRGALPREAMDRLLRGRARALARSYYEFAHKPGEFLAGQSPVPVSGRVYDDSDLAGLLDSALDFWLTSGRCNNQFEARFADYLGVKRVLTTNSGSSANLLCLAALTSPKLGGKALRPGDEVITVAAGFPTTLNPILQHGMVPVFVDVDPHTYNIDPARLDQAISGKTRAIIIAHTLGNPFDLEAVLRLAQAHGLWVVEDCCDALGAEYDLPPDVARPSGVEPQRSARVGSFGHLAAFSFYPAHHITMGEGGAVAVNDDRLAKVVESFRDWGRDCWCPPGRDNTCGCRFEWKLGQLPAGYDHKYVYSHPGYNLKITDMQAAVGLAQLAHLDDFLAARQQNMDLLLELLRPLSDVLALPRATPRSRPAWFGCPMTIRPGTGLGREELMRQLNQRKIGIRLLFGGNLTRQPYMAGRKFRVAGGLEVSDRIMRDTFWVGVYPGLGRAQIHYMAQTISQAFGR